MREGGECLPGADVSVFIRRDYSDLTQRIEPSNVPPRCLFIHSDIIIAAQPPRCSDCVDTHKDAHEITVCGGHGKVIFLRIAK